MLISSSKSNSTIACKHKNNNEYHYILYNHVVFIIRCHLELQLQTVVEAEVQQVGEEAVTIATVVLGVDVGHHGDLVAVSGEGGAGIAKKGMVEDHRLVKVHQGYNPLQRDLVQFRQH